MQVSLNQVAAAIGCHQRTVLRAITGEDNPNWSASIDPKYTVKQIAKAFGCNAELLEAIFHGTDKLLSPAQAAKRLRCTERTLRNRSLPALVRHGGVIRYSETTLDLIQAGIF